MTEQNLPQPGESGFPEAVDDDYPERARYPEPEEPPLPADEGYPGSGAVGTTADEQVLGESLDEKLGRERPEPTVDPLKPRDPDEPVEDDALDASDVAGPATLVEPDEGAHPDLEADAVASDASPDGAVAVEEQAVRIEPER